MTTEKLGEDITEEEEVTTLTQRFLQKAEFDAHERIIASHLIEAINGKPLECVIHTCRAAMTLEEEDQSDLGINIKEVESIYGCATVLSSATEIKDPHSNKSSMCLLIDTLDWNRDLKPWVKNEHTISHIIPLQKWMQKSRS